MGLLPPNHPDVAPYDFRRPPWINRERRAVLDGIHARLLPGLGQFFTAQFRQPVTLVLRDIAQVTFGDWRATLPSPCVSYVMALGGTAGNGLLAIEPAFALRLVDLLFGGQGEPGNRPSALTTLEQTVLGQLVDRFLTVLREGYREVMAFTPGVARFEEILERLAIVDRHDRIQLIELEFRIGELTGVWSFCVPAVLLTPFTQGAFAPAASAEPPRALLEAHLRAARVPVVVRLPGFRIRARDGAALEGGQVLETSHPFHGAVEVHVNGRRLFIGALGRQQGHVGLRVLAPAESTPPTPSRTMRRIDPS